MATHKRSMWPHTTHERYGPHLWYLLFPALFEQQGARKKFHLVVQNKWISFPFWASNYFYAQLPVLIGKGPVKLSWLKLNKDSHATALEPNQTLKAACPKDNLDRV